MRKNEIDAGAVIDGESQRVDVGPAAAKGFVPARRIRSLMNLLEERRAVNRALGSRLIELSEARWPAEQEVKKWKRELAKHEDRHHLPTATGSSARDIQEYRKDCNEKLQRAEVALQMNQEAHAETEARQAELNLELHALRQFIDRMVEAGAESGLPIQPRITGMLTQLQTPATQYGPTLQQHIGGQS